MKRMRSTRVTKMENRALNGFGFRSRARTKKVDCPGLMYGISLSLPLTRFMVSSVSFLGLNFELKARGQMVGGAFLSASLQVLFDRMASLQVIDFIRGKRLNEGLFKKLKIKLLSAHFVLNDAEQKQIWNSAVREWLDELHEAIYDAEDLVDKINTEALRCKMEAEYGSSSTHQVLNLFPTRTSTSFNEHVEYKMMEILDRLEFILDQKDSLGLKGDVQTKPSRRLPTTSSVEESGVYGRNNDKEAIIELLLTDNGSGNDNMSVIPILGMGGIGKTTLAQLVYNDERVKKCFELKAWVFVSEEFDVFKITKTIKERVTSIIFKGQDLDLLQVQLEKALRDKKFLLVLDDIWNEDYFMWEVVKKPFECGAYGSKIIVTTRNESVASVMCNNVQSYQLATISDENCWKLFVKHAFNNVHPYVHPKLEEIGRQIVIKCKGLPLAVKSLGSLLRNQLNPDEWEKILQSDMWELPKEKNSILPALWLSYHYLPSHLKRCFAYCSVFPKNHEIDKEDLIKLWMAEDLLKAQKDKRIEEVGEESIKDLVSRSLFRQVLREPWYEKSPICYTMHDLVHDLATFVAGEFCLSLDVNNSNKFLNKVRHLSQENEKEHKYDLKRYEYLFRAKCLRTFFFPLQCYGGIQLQLQNLVAIKLLPTLTCLRVLSLNGSSITELPDSIGNLKLLRYLNLSKTRIKEMPIFLCALYNLQTLILSHCGQLKLLPTDIGRLINLRHLDITDTGLERMPLEIGNLKDLQTLTEFIVGKDSGSTLKSLRDLQHLRGKLCFSELNNIVNVEDILVANLKDKKYLTQLEFWWDYFDDIDNYQMHSRVLNGLETHRSLKLLKIENYRGQQFPKWVGDPSFCNLEKIRLGGCEECSILPPLGQLPFLKHLMIEGFDELVTIGDEFYCITGGSLAMARPFGCLEILEFYNLQKWEEWSFVDQVEGRDAFPNLKKLVLGCCPNLTAHICLPNTIQEVSIRKCRKLELLGMQQLFGNLGKLHIEESCDTVNSIAIDYLPVLEELTLESCENLESLTCSGQPQPPALLSLTSFELKGCTKFVSFHQGGLPAPNLKYFCIADCINLRSLPQHMHTLLPSLQSLSLANCPELESFPEC
nr:putative disease resistance RPP13-like protein 1 [Ziziphus jujuba var. spinosa]